MLRLIPPAGAPITIRQVMRAVVKASLARSRSNQVLDAFAARLRVQYIFALSSGRAGLWAILQALHRLRPERNVVAVPAYICFSVPASIVRAGLKIEPVDVDPETLDYNFSKLDAVRDDKLLCVMAANLFGIPNDMSRIQKVGYAKRAYVIDNAAQSLGAIFQGRFVGTSGDVGLYSFGRGKALTLLEGGIVITNSREIAESLSAMIAGARNPTLRHNARLFFQMLAYAVFLNPRLYWIPNSIPFLRLGVTEFDPNFRVSNLSALCKALLLEVEGQLDMINRARQENARILRAELAHNRHFTIPLAAPEFQGIYIRMPLIAADETIRQTALRKLQSAGIGASSFYPSAICDIPEIGEHMARPDFHCPEAESLARRLLTLPTHPLLAERDRTRMLEVLSSL